MILNDTLETSSVPLSPSDEYLGLKLAYRIVTNYSWIVTVVVGVPGNILSAAVATRKHNRNLSPCIYMTAMAVADTAQLLQQPWTMLLLYSSLGDHIKGLEREFLFKLDWYVNYTFGMLSSLFLMEMSVDRLIAVKFPMSVSRLCTPSRAKKAVITTAVIIIILNISTFWNHQYVKDELSGTEVLFVSVPGHPELELLTTALQMLIGTVLPFVVIATCNIIIIITVRRASEKRRKLEGGKDKSGNGKNAHMTRMLIFVSVAYAITSLPYRLYYVLVDIPQIASYYNMADTYWNLRYNVQVWVVFELWCWNYAVNFYLYCIGGGAKYRRDTKKVLASVFRCCRPKKESSS